MLSVEQPIKSWQVRRWTIAAHSGHIAEHSVGRIRCGDKDAGDRVSQRRGVSVLRCAGEALQRDDEVPCHQRVLHPRHQAVVFVQEGRIGVRSQKAEGQRRRGDGATRRGGDSGPNTELVVRTTGRDHAIRREKRAMPSSPFCVSSWRSWFFLGGLGVKMPYPLVRYLARLLNSSMPSAEPCQSRAARSG